MVFFVLFCFCLFFESSGVGPLLKGWDDKTEFKHQM